MTVSLLGSEQAIAVSWFFVSNNRASDCSQPDIFTNIVCKYFYPIEKQKPETKISLLTFVSGVKKLLKKGLLNRSKERQRPEGPHRYPT